MSISVTDREWKTLLKAMDIDSSQITSKSRISIKVENGVLFLTKKHFKRKTNKPSIDGSPNMVLNPVDKIKIRDRIRPVIEPGEHVSKVFIDNVTSQKKKHKSHHHHRSTEDEESKHKAGMSVVPKYKNTFSLNRKSFDNESYYIVDRPGTYKLTESIARKIKIHIVHSDVVLDFCGLATGSDQLSVILLDHDVQNVEIKRGLFQNLTISGYKNQNINIYDVQFTKVTSPIQDSLYCVFLTRGFDINVKNVDIKNALVESDCGDCEMSGVCLSQCQRVIVSDVQLSDSKSCGEFASCISTVHLDSCQHVEVKRIGLQNISCSNAAYALIVSNDNEDICDTQNAIIVSDVSSCDVTCSEEGETEACLGTVSLNHVRGAKLSNISAKNIEYSGESCHSLDSRRGVSAVQIESSSNIAVDNVKLNNLKSNGDVCLAVDINSNCQNVSVNGIDVSDVSNTNGTELHSCAAGFAITKGKGANGVNHNITLCQGSIARVKSAVHNSFGVFLSNVDGAKINDIAIQGCEQDIYKDTCEPLDYVEVNNVTISD